MTDLLTEPLPTVWEGRAIDPDYRHTVSYTHLTLPTKLEV